MGREPALRGLDASVPVVVLKMHHGSLGIARSLGRLGVAVHGLTADLDAPPARSRYWRACHLWDIDRASPEQSLDYLRRLGRSIGQKAVLVAVSDATALLVAEHAPALRGHYLFHALPAPLVQSLASKKEMYGVAQRLDIATAGTAFPQSRADVMTFLRTAVFPVMVKGIDGVRLYLRVNSKMAIARDEDELLELYDRWEEPGHPNLMLQEYIPGGDDTVWMFNGYFDQDSNCLVGWTGQKLRQIPVAMGSTTLGVCRHNAEVDTITRRFMQRIGYRGILDIGYRFDARDGRYKVLDVNPRIGSTFRLFVDDNGLDVARAAYLDLTGQPVPRQAEAEGRKWVVEDQDAECFYKTWRAGRLGVRAWLRSLRGVREAAWFAPDDLRPFFAITHILGLSFWRKIVHRLQRDRAAAPQRARGAKS